jgi:hypothetical protein
MSDQYTMTEEATFDSQTGEIVEPKLSEKAMRGVRRPNLWKKRDDTHVGLMAGDEFAYAFLCVQERVRPIIEADKANPFAKGSKAGDGTGYTSLGGLLKIVRPILNEFYITVEQYAGDVFGLTDAPGNKHLFLPVFTRLEHIPSMQHKIYRLPMPLVKFDCQAVGSAMTYGSRYGLMRALGIASGVDDDDGNAASVTKGIDSTLSEFAQGLADKIKAFRSIPELKRWAKDNASGFDILEQTDREKLRVIYDEQLTSLQDTQDKPESGKKK